MAINVGFDKISEVQRRYLVRVQRGLPYPELLYVLHRVVADRHIQSGLEDLHPDWLEIFERNRDRLESVQNPGQREMFIVIRDAMDDLLGVDKGVGLIDPQKENIAFLLGAGASKPAPSNIPTVAELLRELFDRAGRLDREQMTELAEFCRKEGIDNIEDLLTAVQISAFCSRNPRILRLVEYQLLNSAEREDLYFTDTTRPARTDVSSLAYVQETLQLLFGLLSSLMLPARPNSGHDAIVEFITKNRNSNIITTNYDCCMDLALLNSPLGLTYNIGFSNPDVLPNRSNSPVSLIKLHGSLNWFYCETCQVLRLIDIERAVDDYENKAGEYPIITICDECGGQRRALLVPPHAMKFDFAPPLQPLIADAAKNFESSSIIVVVGFSFSEADLYISRMLIKAMQTSNDKKMVIVDPNEGVAQRIRGKFKSQIPEFDADSRILMIGGDCAQILPEFLRGEYFASETEGREKGQPIVEEMRAISVSD